MDLARLIGMIPQLRLLDLSRNELQAEGSGQLQQLLVERTELWVELGGNALQSGNKAAVSSGLIDLLACTAAPAGRQCKHAVTVKGT